MLWIYQDKYNNNILSGFTYTSDEVEACLELKLWYVVDKTFV